jgi:adenylate cyclase
MVEDKPTEIERKWLVTTLPELEGVVADELLQGYIAISADGTEVRLRRKGNKFFQTVKTDGTLVRSEFEIELSQEQFDQLWATTEGRRIEKTRYVIPQREIKIEIDVYKGQLSGLLIAEVEFTSTAESALFASPAWFGREVTDDGRYKNKRLATEGRPN